MLKMIDSIHFVLSEHKQNMDRIWYIAKSHVKKQTSVTTLGFGWVLVHDIVYFLTFGVFRYMLSGGNEIDGMNLVMYLLTGIVPWFFINDVLNIGSRCFTMNRYIYSSMKFPTSIIPTFETVAIFIKRLLSFALLMIATAAFGYFKYFSILLFLYYMIAAFLLAWVLNLIISPLVAISKDLDQMYRAILRVLFFLVPVIWSFSEVQSISSVLVTILKVNPIVYVLNGFRDAFFFSNMPELAYTLYFWGFILVMFVIGSVLQCKLNKYYDDWV